MKSETVWTVVASATVAASILSVVLGILCLRRNETLPAGISFAAAAILSGSMVLAFLICREEQNEESRAAFVDCFRLKRPGIEKQSGDVIIPKGKMPRDGLRHRKDL